MEKLNVILDTDVCNEIDDCFAISYLLANDDKVNIEAITIAPFKVNSKNISVEEGVEKSYNEVLKIFKIFNKSYPLYKGSISFTDNNYFILNDAVKAIIDICRKNNETTIIGIGAITNIALALRFAPDIKNKIKIVWLGTGHPLNKEFNDTNIKNDFSAFKFVYESDVDLTIISTIMSKANRISIYELENRLNNSIIKDYLVDCLKYQYVHYEENNKCFTCHDILPIDLLLNSDSYKLLEIDKPKLNENYSFNFKFTKGKIKFLTWSNHYSTITHFFDSINNFVK